MLQVRQGVFETNSSSSHSIIIKKKNLPLSEKVNAEWRIRKMDENDPKNGTAEFYDAIVLRLRRMAAESSETDTFCVMTP